MMPTIGLNAHLNPKSHPLLSAGNDQEGLYSYVKVMPATWEKQPDPHHLLYVDKNIRLGHWPVSVLMNGYSLFVAQLHQLKKVGA
jgi:hypothetical protein